MEEPKSIWVWLRNAEDLLKFREYTEPNYLVEVGVTPYDYYQRQGYILVQQLPFNPPEVEVTQLRESAVKGLQEQLSALQAESFKKETELKARIGDLLMIGYDSETAEG